MKKKFNYYGLERPYFNFQRLLLVMKISTFLLLCGMLNAFSLPSDDNYPKNRKVTPFTGNLSYGNVNSLQQRTISGVVTDRNGNPLPGVSVTVPGTTTGIITDANGSFTLSVPASAKTLSFSFVGMTPQEVEIGTQTVFNIVLQETSVSLEEVVVVGYGTQRKVNLTGAVSSLGEERLVTTTTPNLSNNLTGKLPGLRVQTYGSEPGIYDNSIDIRGWGTMLVVVDGVPREDFQRIDPSAIESISILKDASAAVYGVKAANGVMLITTKKGTSGRSDISVNTSWGFQYMTDFPRSFDNSIDALIIKNEAALVAGNPLPYPDWEKYTGTDPNYPSVDWWDLTVKEFQPMSKNDISFTGGSDRMTYFVSLGNLHETGIYKTNSMDYDRYNFRANITANIVKGLNANVIFAGMIDSRNDPYGSSSYDFMKQVWMQPTYQPVYANNTEPFFYDGEADRNPLAITKPEVSGYRKYRTKRAETTISLAYDIPFVKGLQIKGLYAYDVKYDRQKLWRKKYFEYKYIAASDTYTSTGLHSPARLQEYFYEWIYSQAQLSLNYNNKFENHDIGGLLLVDRRNGDGDYYYGQKYFDLTTLDQLTAGLTADAVASGNDYVLDANLALVGRFNYSFKSKYLAEFSFRYDGSSLFPSESRFGFFPAISFGWRLGEESFIRDNLNFISALKLRVSYGQMGDDSGASGFQYITGYTYPSGSYMFDGSTLTSGTRTKGLSNQYITWYTATTTNFGLDGTLWRGLLDFTFEYFRRTRDGLLGTRAEVLPLEFGATFPQQNLNSDFSSGFELIAGHTRKVNDFLYSIRGNISFTKQKYLHIEAADPGNSYLYWRNYNEERFKNITWGYGSTGQFQSQEEINKYQIVQSTPGFAAYFPGDVKYEDWNEDGMIDDHDTYPIKLGIDPEIYYGLELSGGWKGLAVNLLFQGASRYTQMPVEQLLGPLPWGRNTLTIFNDRWRHEDPLDFSTPWVAGKYPISRDGFGFAPNKLTSTYWCNDVAYLRLKSIELSYSLPSAALRVIHAKEIRLFTNAFNTLTWKRKGVMFDPEKRQSSGSGGDYGYKYPVMATCNFGLSVTF